MTKKWTDLVNDEVYCVPISTGRGIFGPYCFPCFESREEAVKFQVRVNKHTDLITDRYVHVVKIFDTAENAIEWYELEEDQNDEDNSQ